MASQENPSSPQSLPANEPASTADSGGDIVDSLEPVEATLVEAVDESRSKPVAGDRVRQLEVPQDFFSTNEDLAAMGGVVGSIVLGVWSMIGAFITPYSVVNAMLGLLLGCWGLRSAKPKVAWIGLGLSATGAFLCFINAARFW